MAEPSKETPRVPIVQRTLLHPEQPPRAASQFYYAVLGDSIQLDVAHIDVPAAREAIEKARAGDEAQTVHFYITDRFILTPEAALGLLTTATELVKTLRIFGKLPPAE